MSDKRPWEPHTRQATGKICHFGYAIRGKQSVRCCDRKHRTWNAAAACATRMANRLNGLAREKGGAS